MASQQALMEIAAQVVQRDFERGYFLVRKMGSPLHLPRVQVGLCLTGAALCASTIPTCVMYFRSVWGPACGIGFFLFLAGLFGWMVPALAKSRGGWMYAENRTLSLPYTLRIFPDHLEWTTCYEQVSAYWTDVERCFENKDYYVLTGDLEKPLLVLPKHGLSQQVQEDLTRFFRNQFAVRYRGG